MGIFHFGFKGGWGGGVRTCSNKFKAVQAVLQILAGDALIQTAGAVFLVGLFEPHNGETFSANIAVLINCFRGVTCIPPIAVGLFTIDTVVLKRC